MPLEVRPATAERFGDLETVLGPKDPEAPACWCLSYRVSSGDQRLKDGTSRRAVMRELCLDVPPRPDDAADALAAALTGWFQR